MERKSVKLLKKDVYGRSLFYPLCEISKLVCAIQDRKCLRDSEILKMQELGWKTEIEKEV